MERTIAATVVVRLVMFGGLWWLITAGRTDAWLVGLPAVAVAAALSIRLSAPVSRRIVPRALPAFLGLFLRESVAGGIDVARRTLARRMRVQPGFMRYRLRFQDQGARVLLVNCISLLPGTLAADLIGDEVELHLLDAREDPGPQLRKLECAIGRLFGIGSEQAHA